MCPSPAQATQLFEMFAVRHGLMLVGAPLSGKSCALACLADALGDLAAKDAKGSELYAKVQARS